MTGEVILSVKDLNVKFRLRGRELHAIRGVSLDVYRGESLAVVGESGSGKSVFTKTFMGLLDANGFISSGQILYGGQDLAKLYKEKDWQKIRGGEIAMIMQDPMTSLNPLKSIGEQIAEAVRLHQKVKKKEEIREKVLGYLRDVGIPEPERRYRQFAHEFSGGMRQRVVIAIALACNPRILICDEPTTALDVTIQAQIMKLLKELQKENGMAVILITHDIGLVARMADRVLVMYAGQLIEEAPVKELFKNPRHPYTQALLSSVPTIRDAADRQLEAIPGIVPENYDDITGCRFAGRCRYYQAACDKRQEDHQVGPGHTAKCVRRNELLSLRENAD